MRTVKGLLRNTDVGGGEVGNWEGGKEGRREEGERFAVRNRITGYRG